MNSNDGYNSETGFPAGTYKGWICSFNSPDLIPTYSAKQCGVYLGEVVGIRGEQVTVRLSDDADPSETATSENATISSAISGHHLPPIQPGERVFFENGHVDVQAEGQVYVAEYYQQDVTLTIKQQDFDLDRVQVGDRAWKH